MEIGRQFRGSARISAATLVMFVVIGASLSLSAEEPADRIVIEKSAHRMALYRSGLLVHQYKVSLGGQPVGPKTRQGDHRTPEGQYFIEGRNEHSHYYKSLRISYPNATDLQRAREQKVSPGGDIMIHGLPNGERFIGKLHLLHDWTEGCIAVTDEEMDEIWALVRVGTPVEIRP
ncbi:ErfK/YbiS/YcfS/YnhG [Candidatus Koribacter versatilis Ellin345]|uniref:ErfK/YbiS/YcfS/YnhG n=1 Tax=Koribacter versatilis (strain Ellin345) TaxID=204669 RepID=Q1IK29_KORVE|nr:L,D-transpeptidase family protein [Candidatus Koribacter versatilis]ABF42771.1 ErfK/YbiS/YcfS/YnhG [Candidatus Koribacter versatilis Ellin345]